MDQIDGNYEEFEDSSSLGPLNEGIYNSLEEESLHLDNCDYEEKHFNHEKDMLSHKLWTSFQTAACSVAQLYKDRESGLTYWIPFQNAATNVTSLYKECIESIRRNADIYLQMGIKKRNAELLAWAKKRKRFIRREDLIGFLKGEITNIEQHHNHSNNYHHHQHFHYAHHRDGSWNKLHRPSPTVMIETSPSTTPGFRTPSHTLTNSNNSNVNNNLTRSFEPNDVNPEDGDLQTFREALAISVAGLRNSQQSGIDPVDFINSCTNRRNSHSKVLPTPNLEAASATELSEFISNEYSRHVESRKRVNSSTDVTMDSPTHKRTRLL